MDNIRINLLINEISRYSNVVIYGAGCRGRQLYELFSSRGVKISSVIVTEGDLKEYMGIPVYNFEWKKEELKSEDTIIVIGVTNKYEKEIEAGLLENHIYNYIKIPDYTRNETFEYYKNLTKEEYIKEIAKWYADTYGGNTQDTVVRMKNYRNENVKTNYKKIAFTLGCVMPRVSKIAAALKKLGFIIEMIVLPQYFDKTNILPQLEEYGNVHYCTNVEEVMWCLYKSDAFVNHIFNQWADSIYASIIINMKELFPKMVYEQYDVLCDMYTTISEYQIQLEKFCMENADGVCCRGFETQYLREKKGYNIRDFIFLDYCDEINDEILDEEAEELSICYVGGIKTEREQPNASYACFLELAELCEKNKCHFHVYPSTWEENRWIDYMEYEKTHQYFHFHKPVSYDKLCQEISQYDYGVHPIKSTYKTTDNQGYITNKKLIYTVTNKYFDYIQAGLPIIAATPVKFAELFEEKGMLIKWTIEQYDFAELKRCRKQMKELVKKNRNYFDVENKIKDLVIFYKKV